MTNPLFGNYESISTDDGSYRYCWSKGHVNLDDFANIVAETQYLDWLIIDGKRYDEKDYPTPELLNHIKTNTKYRWATVTDDFWEFASETNPDAIPVTVFIY